MMATPVSYSKGARWLAFDESVERCRFCRYWRAQAGGRDGALCRGHGKVAAQIKREEKGLPPPKPIYTHCPEHGCEIDADGSCGGCDSLFSDDDFPIFHEGS